jgi:hypothetical protein
MPRQVAYGGILAILLAVAVLLLITLPDSSTSHAAGVCPSTLCVHLSPHLEKGHTAGLRVHISTLGFGPQLTLRFTGLLHWQLVSDEAGCQGTYDQDWGINGWGNGNDWRYNHFHQADACDLSFALVPERAGRQQIAARVYLRGTSTGGIDPSSEVESLAWRWTGTVQP